VKRFIPNALTSLNLLAGAVSVPLFFAGEFRVGASLIILAAVFDFLDGFAARLLNARSEIGAQLDSLADVVSFGFAPSIAIYCFMVSRGFEPAWVSNAAFFIVVFSAIRLAKFNVDTRQTDEFIGLPTPANALALVMVPLLMMDSDFIPSNFELPLFLGIITLSSVLMVSELRLVALKFKTWAFAENLFRYLLILASPIILFVFGMQGFPLIIILYLILSLIKNGISKN
jgi:CDP-diacylglycerol--serine O-phosphatidyltransferase